MLANNKALALSVTLENNAPSHEVQKAWGLVTLQTSPFEPNFSLPVDFVLAVDISASVRAASKLAFYQHVVDFLLSKLDENQTFSLVAFNHDIHVLAELRPCTPANKRIILSLLPKLQVSGASKPSNALFGSTAILNKRSGYSRSRVSTLMLFTDEKASVELSSDTLRYLAKLPVPAGCIFNTFGFGPEHDSKLLYAIAMKSQGLYSYLESAKDIPETVGKCVSGMLSIRVHGIDIRLCAQDGARIVTLASPFKISENQVAKDYGIKLDLMNSGESKSILFRLSLRAMPPITTHHLLFAEVSYFNAFTCRQESTSMNVSVLRPPFLVSEKIPIPLDQYINRYSAATSITEAIELAKQFDFLAAQLKLKNTMELVQNSSSARTPLCQDVISDLRHCMKAMSDPVSFQTGIQFASACSSQYFMEKRNGESSSLLLQNSFGGSGYTQQAVPWQSPSVQTASTQQQSSSPLWQSQAWAQSPSLNSSTSSLAQEQSSLGSCSLGSPVESVGLQASPLDALGAQPPSDAGWPQPMEMDCPVRC